MKQWHLFAMVTFCFLGFSLAQSRAPSTPLIVKTNYSGYTTPEFRRQQTCKIYEDHAEVVDVFGVGTDRELTTRKRILLTSVGIINSILLAKDEKQATKPNYLCDGPSTTITAYYPSADDRGGDLLLYSTGGCGADKVQRSGVYTNRLLEIIDSVCPKTVH